MKVFKKETNGQTDAKNPMKEQMQVWEDQIQTWKDRVQFLKRWIDNLRTPVQGELEGSRDMFERENKIWELQIEIEAKENVIDKRHRDMDKARVMLEKQMDDLKKNWGNVLKDLQKLRDEQENTLPVEHRNLINGIIKRGKRNQYANGQQQFQDMELAKNILASRHKVN